MLCTVARRTVQLTSGTVGGQVDFPDVGGTGVVGEEARSALAQRDRVQGNALAGRVDRLAAAARFGIKGAAGRDKGRHIGDGVMDHIAVAAALKVHGLVQVLRGGWVDGDERQGGEVRGGKLVAGNDGIHLRQDVGGETVGQLELVAQGGQGLGKGLLGGTSSDANVRVGHGFSVNDSPAGTRAARHTLRLGT